jgi:hypothetical protein
MMVDAFKLPICALLQRDAKIHIHSCVPMACAQLLTVLVLMRGPDARLIWSSVTMDGALPAMALALPHHFMLEMDVLSQLARILTDVGMVNVLRVLALVQFLKAATVVTLHLQTVLFAPKHVLLVKCDVLMVLAMLKLHARQPKDVI